MALPELTLVGRIALAFALGFILGFERELKGHEAGLRTHILVCLGACLFTLAGTYGFPFQQIQAGGSSVRIDVSRVASQIVVGIGFLGGGTILRQENTIRGLTTAANLWVAAAIGLGCALGFYLAVGVITGFVLVSLVFFKPLERWAAKLGHVARKGEPPDPNA